MVETDAVDQTVAHELKQQRVNVVEDARALDPHADQVGDLEEAAVGEVFARRAPIGGAPDLRLVQLMQRRLVRSRRGERLVEHAADGRVARERSEVFLQLRGGLRPGDREAAGELGKRLRVDAGEDARIGGRRQRQAEIVIGEGDAAVARIEGEAEAAAGERVAIGLAERRHDQLRRRPVDVEVLAEIALRPPFQHVAPPGIGGRRAHMVRHEIEDQPEAARLQRRRQAPKALHPADRRVDRAEIRHVVAVR